MHQQHYHHGDSHTDPHEPGVAVPAQNSALRTGIRATLHNWLQKARAVLGHQHEGPGHVHDTVLSTVTGTERGLWAVKWSFGVMTVTAALQLAIVSFTGSAALLADTVHNFTDSAIAVPLWVSLVLARRLPGTSNRFTYGLGRVEDLAGVVIVLAILFSGVFVAYESFDRLLHPQQITFLWAVAGAAVIGFIGNEAVAIFRIRVGKQIGSAALVADGYHARVDGLTSLGVLFGTIGVWLGFPFADPVVGLVISAVIFGIVFQTARPVFIRLLDGVDPHIVDNISRVASLVPGVQAVTEVRARWSGHFLLAELSLSANVENAYAVAAEARHQLLHKIPQLTSVTIHVAPALDSGEEQRLVIEHAHDNLPFHSHAWYPRYS